MKIYETSTAASEVGTVENANEIIAAINVAIDESLVAHEKAYEAYEAHKAEFGVKPAHKADLNVAIARYNELEKAGAQVTKLIKARAAFTLTRDYIAQ